MDRVHVLHKVCTVVFVIAAITMVAHGQKPDPVIFSDYAKQKPGQVHRITLRDLPSPNATPSVDNGPDLIERPPNAIPQAPPGFKVELYATGLMNPRLMRTAPNGDVFLAESRGGEVKVFRGITAEGKYEQMQTFAKGLRQPFGIAFYPPGPNPKYIYIANTNSVVRFAYKSGDLKASSPAQVVIKDIPGGGHLRGGGHWTRDIAFSKDGTKMYVSVGSHSNNDDTDNNPVEKDRADILEFNPDGSGRKVYAWGIRNAVGIAVNPQNGELWASVNERDTLGENLVPDYITHVEPNGFYGWPWWYMGPHQDPDHRGKHPELRDKVIAPDVLIQPHSASLQMSFYDGSQFPHEYLGNIFAAEHGSWNRKSRSGYEVVRIKVDANGRANGSYEDFLTGFITQDGQVWGRPVGITVAKDGSLLVSDDGSNSIWRVSHSR